MQFAFVLFVLFLLILFLILLILRYRVRELPFELEKSTFFELVLILVLFSMVRREF